MIRNWIGLLLVSWLFLLFLAGCGGSPGGEVQSATDAQEAPVQVSRPQFTLETQEVFDLETIPTFSENADDVYAHIDANLTSHIEQLQRWVRQPSISSENAGIGEMAALLRDDLLGMGFSEAEIVPTDGHPGVWGYYDAGAPRTLLVYMMYDVQPVDEAKWSTPPFAGNLVNRELGTVLMARGVSNQKGPQRAFLNALSSIIAVKGKLPVNIMITADGEEEMGSIHYPQLVDRYEARLKQAHGVLFPMNGQNSNGRMRVPLGVKGIVYYELSATGGSWGGPKNHAIHGSLKAITDSPVWRLVQALASLTTVDGNTVTIEGYYDGIVPPGIEEQRLINAMAVNWDTKQLQAELGVERWMDGRSGQDLVLEYLYGATLNIDGIWGGYTGPGSKTVLPHQATAKVDSRLPPGLDPERAVRLVREHLDANGFTDVKLEWLLDGYSAAQTSVSDPWVRAALGVLKKYGHPMSVEPRLAGSAPFYIFTERLKLPFFFTALGHGANVHAPDEYMVIHPKAESRVAGLAEVEKSYVDLIYAFAAVD